LLEHLEAQTRLTRNQHKIILAAMLGDLLEFFDYFLIGFVLAFIAAPWHLTFGKSAVILLSSGIGAMLGAVCYGWLADQIGRRTVFIVTVLNFSVATGVLAFTPENGWIFLSVFRFLIGFGVGGLYCVDLPLTQEFVPASKRGLVGGIVTCTIPLGLLLGALMGATLTPYIGWRGLFALGAVPAVLTLLIRVWVPESPRWLLRMGRPEEARESLAWALQVPSHTIALPTQASTAAVPRIQELFRFPKMVGVSWSTNLAAQTGYYGLHLWAPTLLVQLLAVPPSRAAFLMIFVNLSGFVGRIAFSVMSDTLGRRACGGLFGIGAAVMLLVAAAYHDAFAGAVSVFWLLLIATNFFADGGWAILGPYSAEIWPSHLRTTGLGAAYGFGGLGKIIGPLGLALIVGSTNVISPQASVSALLPAYMFLASAFAVVGLVLVAFGTETKGRSLEAVEADLVRAVVVRQD
jgi:putative MFS transporter